jgi:hypothetical protein
LLAQSIANLSLNSQDNEGAVNVVNGVIEGHANNIINKTTVNMQVSEKNSDEDQGNEEQANMCKTLQKTMMLVKGMSMEKKLQMDTLLMLVMIL